MRLRRSFEALVVAGARIATIERIAGSKVKLRKRAIITPAGAKSPTFEIASMPAPWNEARPAAVVRLVRTRASPEWPSA